MAPNISNVLTAQKLINISTLLGSAATVKSEAFTSLTMKHPIAIEWQQITLPVTVCSLSSVVYSSFSLFYQPDGTSLHRLHFMPIPHTKLSLIFVNSFKSFTRHITIKKGKVDNLYRGSKWSRSLQNRCYNTPLFIGPHVKWLPHTGALTWKPSQGTKLYCLVNRGTLVWTTCPRSLPDNAAAGNWTHDLPIASPMP